MLLKLEPLLKHPFSAGSSFGPTVRPPTQTSQPPTPINIPPLPPLIERASGAHSFRLSIVAIALGVAAPTHSIANDLASGVCRRRAAGGQSLHHTFFSTNSSIHSVTINSCNHARSALSKLSAHHSNVSLNVPDGNPLVTKSVGLAAPATFSNFAVLPTTPCWIQRWFISRWRTFPRTRRATMLKAAEASAIILAPNDSPKPLATDCHPTRSAVAVSAAYNSDSADDKAMIYEIHTKHEANATQTSRTLQIGLSRIYDRLPNWRRWMWSRLSTEWTWHTGAPIDASLSKIPPSTFPNLNLGVSPLRCSIHNMQLGCRACRQPNGSLWRRATCIGWS